LHRRLVILTVPIENTVVNRILLVEDNKDDLDLTLRAFRKQNFEAEITVARDGQDALDQLAGELPDVVLLDLKLPKVSGLDVLRRIRSDPRTALLPVVVLTSSTEQKDMVESYARGANSYVRKPVRFDDFMEAARQLGLYWLSLNRTPGP
jgi:two-component system response regulator